MGEFDDCANAKQKRCIHRTAESSSKLRPEKIFILFSCARIITKTYLLLFKRRTKETNFALIEIWHELCVAQCKLVQACMHKLYMYVHVLYNITTALARTIKCVPPHNAAQQPLKIQYKFRAPILLNIRVCVCSRT